MGTLYTQFSNNSLAVVCFGLVSVVVVLMFFSLFGLYPIPLFEKVVDPHLWYIKDFVHSLPPEDQADMSEKAQALGMDIYQYTMQMCGYQPDSYWAWWGLPF